MYKKRVEKNGEIDKVEERERERERRPCAIRREIVEKDGTKRAAQEAALSIPELLVRV